MAKSIYSFCQLYFLWMVGLAFLLLIGFTSVCSFIAGQLIVRFRTADIEPSPKMHFSASWYVSAINILINIYY